MGSYVITTPKRHFLARKHVIWRIDRQNRSSSVKKKKVYWETETCNKPRPPTLSQRHVDLRVWSYPRRSFPVSSKSVQGFSEPTGVEICPFLFLWLFAFTTACTTVQAVNIMATLCNKAGNYIFALWFLSSFFFLSFFPSLISAAADWMSTVLRHLVWPYCEFRMQVWNVLWRRVLFIVI